MTDKEVELVAELLAKIGGNWFPERASHARKMVTGRQRDVARLILAELDRVETAKMAVVSESSPGLDAPEERKEDTSMTEDRLFVGATVEYCPPGDKRTVMCRIEKLDNGRAYIVPVGREVGWVSTHTLLPLKS